MATECRHSSGMAVDEQETIMMNRAMKKKEAWYDGHFLLGPTHFEGIKLDTSIYGNFGGSKPYIMVHWPWV